MIPLMEVRKAPSEPSDPLSHDDDHIEPGRKGKETAEPKKKGVLNTIKHKTFGSSH